MASSHENLPTTGRSLDDLTGLDALLVEDSWDVGQAVKALLELCGATVAGPAATIADAEVLLACHLPDVAIVDLHLRGGERSDSLIARLWPLSPGTYLPRTAIQPGLGCLARNSRK